MDADLSMVGRVADELVRGAGRDDDDVAAVCLDRLVPKGEGDIPGPLPGTLWLRKNETPAPCWWPSNTDEFSPLGSPSTAIKWSPPSADTLLIIAIESGACGQRGGEPHSRASRVAPR